MSTIITKSRTALAGMKATRNGKKRKNNIDKNKYITTITAATITSMKSDPNHLSPQPPQ